MSSVKRIFVNKIKKRMWTSMLKESPLMDEKWYSDMYRVPEEKAVNHYLEEGYMLGYDPSPFFSTNAYYDSYPDVMNQRYPALAHYIQYGSKEKRDARPNNSPQTFCRENDSKGSLVAYSPESMWNRRLSIDEIAEKIIGKDYVSFDIFDTLILRDVISPTDVFRIMEVDCNEPGFAARRESVEKECYRKIGTTTTINDIYRELLGEEGNIDHWVETEFSYELKLCHTNPYMQQVYRKAQELGKHIIIVSDMYWPKEYLIKLLNNAGYNGWDEIFVSCEYGATKHTGLLQETAWEFIGKQCSVVHFGDNYDSDVRGSLIINWEAVWYQSCREKTNMIPNKGFFSIPASIRAAICSNHLNNGKYSFSKEYEHGFLFGGMMACGFCEYINQIASQMNSDAVWFLARDMDIIQNIYRRFYHRYDNEYVYISRAAMRHLNIKKYPLDFYQRYLKGYALSGHLSISQVLKESQLELLKDYFYEVGINGDMLFDIETYDTLYQLYMNHIEEVSESFLSEIEGAKRYFCDLLQNHKRICVVDLGWNGTIMVELERFFKQYFPDIDLTFVLFGAANAQITTDLQTKGALHSYAFSQLHDISLAIESASIRGNTTIMCLESMFSSDSQTLESYSLDSRGEVTLNYGVKTEEKWFVEEIQDGIGSFASMYCELISKLNTPILISPEDAFRPYISISEDYQYLYLLFNQVKEYADGSVATKSNKRLSTIGDIIRKRNLL